MDRTFYEMELLDIKESLTEYLETLNSQALISLKHYQKARTGLTHVKDELSLEKSKKVKISHG